MSGIAGARKGPLWCNRSTVQKTLTGLAVDARLTELLSIVGTIHEASIEPQRWHDALAGMMSLFQSSKGGLIDVNTRTRNITGMTALGHDPDAQREYAGHYYKIDPGASIVYEDGSSSSLYVCYERFSARERARNEYFDFARRVDIGDAMAANSGDLAGRRTVLTLQRSYGAKGFDSVSKNLVLLLRSQIEIAKRVESCLAQARAASHALAAGLDRFAFAAFVLAADGEILHLNEAATALLARDRRFRVRHGRLRLSDRQAQHRLEIGLQRATAPDSRSALMRLAPAGQPGTEATELALAPLRAAHAMASEWQRPLAFMVVGTPPRDANGIAARVRLLYGLTEAEARVMAHLALGRSVEEIALAHEVRVSTVRTQLSSLFAKTGVNRQPDLVRLALGGAPMRGDGP